MLSAGTKLGTYEVTSHIGSGGMGEVYRARDTKLGRDVAVKVLPEHFARNPERISRFQREAKMLAALNHPNVAAIYGLEQSGDTHYLIMELVPGDTLSERIKRDGALPVTEALSIARQIAEALEAAHEKPIIHRDLKPANVKVTPEGRVKVLDFGLAKAFAPQPSPEDLANAPTLSALPTQHGVIMGTPAYMSPEQARGNAVDKRTDIWAFGCVLFELLTGKPVFDGPAMTDVLAAVVRSDPEWSRLPETTPPAIVALLRRCLQKDANRRARDAGDIHIQIEEALLPPTSAAAPAVARPKSAGALGRRGLVLGLGGLVLGASFAALVAWTLRPGSAPPSQPVTHATLTLPAGQQFTALGTGQEAPVVALSPDGTRLVYLATAGGVQQLYMRAMAGQEVRPIEGTTGATNPFFSPDGQWLAFFAGGKLKKVSLNGSLPVTLADVALPFGASWSSLGTIAFAPGLAGPLQQVPESGGAAQPLTQLAEGEFAHNWPEFLPDGKAVLFATGQFGDWRNGQIAVHVMATGERRNLIRGGSFPRYAPSGHLIYAQGSSGTLMAVPFDPERLEVTGTASPVLERILLSGLTGASQYAFSLNGSLVYLSAVLQITRNNLVWVGRSGIEQTLPLPPAQYFRPNLSPDGRKLAVEVHAGKPDIWIHDFPRDTFTRFTFEGSNIQAAWTPAGDRVVFLSYRTGPPRVLWRPYDGSGSEEMLTSNEGAPSAFSFTPDGKVLAFHLATPNTLRDIWTLSLEGDRRPSVFLQTPRNESAAEFSPDGRWLAYASDESGPNEIYVQPFPGSGGKWQISNEGGGGPLWNPNGRELFYRNANKVMAVDIATQPGFAAGTPRLLFEGPYEAGGAGGLGRNYDVSPDGQRFLMVRAAEQQTRATPQIDIVLNWFEDLKLRSR